MKILFLVIAFLPVFASAGNPIQKTKRNALQKKFYSLVLRLNSIPGGKCLSQEVASSFEVPEHWECRLEEVDAESTTDGMVHNANLLVEISTTAAERGARRLVFFSMEWGSDRRSVEYYTFITSLDGELVKALETHSKRDEKGQGVRGSAIDIPQDLKAKEIRDRYKHELEFWLDGKYRKKQKPKKN